MAEHVAQIVLQPHVQDTLVKTCLIEALLQPYHQLVNSLGGYIISLRFEVLEELERIEGLCKLLTDGPEPLAVISPADFLAEGFILGDVVGEGLEFDLFVLGAKQSSRH